MEQQLTLHFIDPSSRTRAELARMAFSLGHHAEVYADLDELIRHTPDSGVIIARDSDDTGGIARVIERMAAAGWWLPVIGTNDTPSTARIVGAMKAGALDYLALPLDARLFARTLEQIGAEIEAHGEARRRMVEARSLISGLSGREREVLDWLSQGSSNKEIARALDISPRTVEIHRANMMAKLGAKHAAEAVRYRIEAEMPGMAAA